MILIGSIILWLAVTIVVTLQLDRYQLVAGLESVGVVVVLLTAAIFYKINEEMDRLKNDPELK